MGPGYLFDAVRGPDYRIHVAGGIHKPFFFDGRIAGRIYKDGGRRSRCGYLIFRNFYGCLHADCILDHIALVGSDQFIFCTHISNDIAFMGPESLYLIV